MTAYQTAVQKLQAADGEQKEPRNWGETAPPARIAQANRAGIALQDVATIAHRQPIPIAVSHAVQHRPAALTVPRPAKAIA